MIATIKHLAREFKTEGGYMIEMIDAKGNVSIRSLGETRERCIEGILGCGYNLDDSQPPNTEYKEDLKSKEPKLV